MKARTVASRTYAIFFSDFWLKLLALVIAFIFWWTVAKDPRAEISVNVPVELHRIPENLEISSEIVSTVQVRVRGAASKLRELQPSNLHAAIDLAGALPGERTYELTPRQVHSPSGIEVMQVLPAQYRISFDFRATREVEVRPRVIGNFASDRRIAHVIAEPAMLKITGPAHRVADVEAALTDPVDASGTMSRATFVTHAYLSDPLVQIVNIQHIRITIVMEKAPPGSTGEIKDQR